MVVVCCVCCLCTAVRLLLIVCGILFDVGLVVIIRGL